MTLINITLTKILIISKFPYIFMAIPIPQNVLNELNTGLYRLTWNKKPDLCKDKQLA